MAHAPQGFAFQDRTRLLGNTRREARKSPPHRSWRKSSPTAPSCRTEALLSPLLPRSPPSPGAAACIPPHRQEQPQPHSCTPPFAAANLLVPPGSGQECSGHRKKNKELIHLLFYYFSVGVRGKRLGEPPQIPAANPHPNMGTGMPQAPRQPLTATRELPRAAPSSRVSGEVRGQEGARRARLLREGGGSPQEIAPHQFPLITQPLCYVGLVAKSVRG